MYIGRKYIYVSHLSDFKNSIAGNSMKYVSKMIMRSINSKYTFLKVDNMARFTAEISDRDIVLPSDIEIALQYFLEKI